MRPQYFAMVNDSSVKGANLSFHFLGQHIDSHSAHLATVAAKLYPHWVGTSEEAQAVVSEVIAFPGDYCWFGYWPHVRTFAYLGIHSEASASHEALIRTKIATKSHADLPDFLIIPSSCYNRWSDQWKSANIVLPGGYALRN